MNSLRNQKVFHMMNGVKGLKLSGGKKSSGDPRDSLADKFRGHLIRVKKLLNCLRRNCMTVRNNVIMK